MVKSLLRVLALLLVLGATASCSEPTLRCRTQRGNVVCLREGGTGIEMWCYRKGDKVAARQLGRITYPQQIRLPGLATLGFAIIGLIRLPFWLPASSRHYQRWDGPTGVAGLTVTTQMVEGAGLRIEAGGNGSRLLCRPWWPIHLNL